MTSPRLSCCFRICSALSFLVSFSYAENLCVIDLNKPESIHTLSPDCDEIDVLHNDDGSELDFVQDASRRRRGLTAHNGDIEYDSFVGTTVDDKDQHSYMQFVWYKTAAVGFIVNQKTQMVTQLFQDNDGGTRIEVNHQDSFQAYDDGKDHDFVQRRRQAQGKIQAELMVAPNTLSPQAGLSFEEFLEEEDLAEPKNYQDPNEPEELQEDRSPFDQRLLSTSQYLQDDGTNIDVMVIWTEEAECRNSGLPPKCTLTIATENNIQAAALLAIEEANLQLVNSKIDLEYHLVFSRVQMGYQEYKADNKDDIGVTLLGEWGRNTTAFKSIHDDRDRYGADLVSFFFSDASKRYGWGNLKNDNSEGDRDDRAFSAVSFNAVFGSVTFGHELAHNLGCNHDRGTKGGDLYCDKATSNFGYRAPDRSFRTMMSSDCNDAPYCDGSTSSNSCPRIPYFSSSTMKYDGKPMGDDNNDNKGNIESQKGYVAKYRSHVDKCQIDADCPTLKANCDDWYCDTSVINSGSLGICKPNCKSFVPTPYFRSDPYNVGAAIAIFTAKKNITVTSLNSKVATSGKMQFQIWHYPGNAAIDASQLPKPVKNDWTLKLDATAGNEASHFSVWLPDFDLNGGAVQMKAGDTHSFYIAATGWANGYTQKSGGSYRSLMFMAEGPATNGVTVYDANDDIDLLVGLAVPNMWWKPRPYPMIWQGELFYDVDVVPSSSPSGSPSSIPSSSSNPTGSPSQSPVTSWSVKNYFTTSNAECPCFEESELELLRDATISSPNGKCIVPTEVISVEVMAGENGSLSFFAIADLDHYAPTLCSKMEPGEGEVAMTYVDIHQAKACVDLLMTACKELGILPNA